MKHIYAIITENCNLHCPHCYIKQEKDDFQKDRFLEVLRNTDARITLFGGEPLLYMDRVDALIHEEEIRKKIDSITTNLLLLDEQRLHVLKTIPMGIGTSWNPQRFHEDQYQQWLNHLHILAEHALHCLVLVTLTPDLFAFGVDPFLKMIRDWDAQAVSRLRFEYLVTEHLEKDYYERADQWLCEIYDQWESPITLDNIYWKEQYYFDCSEEMTLYPDGRLELHCPNHRSIYIPTECYSCERSAICRPCRLQPYCSFPKKFIHKVRTKEENHEKTTHPILL